ncbi:MAG TPA: OmpH family outer membrane protein [Methylomirabilota bacterium]|nr:OmpH family outer membrane protein [Methylomirabilota bacterium]
MRHTLTAALVFVSAVAAGMLTFDGAARAQAPSVTRIGFIDIQRVLVRSAAGVAAREQLEKEKATMQKEMDARRQEFEKLREELEKKGALMSPDARREREETIERKRRDAARLADDLQRELKRKEQQLIVKVRQELQGIIDKLGKQKGYYLILDGRNAGVIYWAPEADLTDEIIRAYDQEAATRGKK